MPDEAVLPDALRDAIAACREALERTPWEPPPLALQHAAVEALASAARRTQLVRLCARSVMPMWAHVHPEDSRARQLLAEIVGEAAPRSGTAGWRQTLEREVPVRDPAYTALRALLLAHDLVHGTAEGVERAPFFELCAYAWMDAPPGLVPAARGREPPERAAAWFRWWLDEALPAAFRSVCSDPGERRDER